MNVAVQRTLVFLEAIKVSHSVFALPFAVAAAFIAADRVPDALLLVKVVLACVAARTAAMSFNRVADAEFDARNPRTASRAVPSGRLSKSFLVGATAASALAFVAIARWINLLAFALSPLALLVVLGYSYTKRFSSLSHLVLGLGLGLSPVGAWIAVRGELAEDSLRAVILGAAVVFWTAGFDVIYACQDRDFDQREGLHSLPHRLGVAGALWLSRLFHAVTVALLSLLGGIAGWGPPYWLGVALVAALLAFEQSLVSPHDLSRVNVAFFTLNGLVSLVFMAAVVLEVVL